MKLRVLSCKNCGDPLKQEHDKLVCQYCGGSYEIEKDSSDIEYEKIANAEEYLRITLQRSKLRLEQEYRAKEEHSREQKEHHHQQMQAIRRSSLRKTIIKLVITMLVVFVGMGFLVKFLRDSDKQKAAEKKEQERMMSLSWNPGYRLTPADLDEDFLNEYYDAILENEKDNHDGAVIFGSDDIWNATDYELMDTWLLTYADRNLICTTVKVTYTKGDGTTKDMYDMACTKNITVDDSGRINSEIKIYFEDSSTMDYFWHSNAELQPLIDENVNAKWEEEDNGCFKFDIKG